MTDALAAAEADKYRRMWAQPAYRRWSPGLEAAPRAAELLDMRPGDSLIDLGAGGGLAADWFAQRGLEVLAVDHVDARARPVPFREACLWSLPADLGPADWVFCADVLEHIPEHRVDAVLANAVRVMRRGGFLLVHCGPDGCGALIGETLHLTVRPPFWWEDTIGRHARVTWVELRPDRLACTIAPREG